MDKENDYPTQPRPKPRGTRLPAPSASMRMTSPRTNGTKKHLPQPEPEQQPKEDSICGFSHMILHTGHPNQLIHWYCSFFDCTDPQVQGILTEIELPTKNQYIGISSIPNASPADPNARTPPVYEMAFLYGNVEDVLRTYMRLKRMKITPFQVTGIQEGLKMHYRDPDGNRVQVHARYPAEMNPNIENVLKPKQGEEWRDVDPEQACRLLIQW